MGFCRDAIVLTIVLQRYDAFWLQRANPVSYRSRSAGLAWGTLRWGDTASALAISIYQCRADKLLTPKDRFHSSEEVGASVCLEHVSQRP
jgi:hypothetical protein